LVPAAASALAMSPDGATVYVTGAGRVSGSRQSEFAVIAYAAATGKKRWLRYYTKEPGGAESVTVSPDGKTVYATGSASSDALTVAYGAAGTLKWSIRYKNPYAGVAAGSQIVAGPAGGVVYVGGVASNKAGHSDVATFAYRAATGEQLWRDRYSVLASRGATNIAVTPGGRTVIVTGSRNNGNHAYAMAAYNASTGGTRWTRLAPEYMFAAGLFIDPLGETMYVGGNRTAAYSVADGTVLWMTSYTHGSGIIGLGGDGTRLFGTRWTSSRGIITVAYQL
jgi:sugar lactone lactonase YvrE